MRVVTNRALNHDVREWPRVDDARCCVGCKGAGVPEFGVVKKSRLVGCVRSW